MVDKTIIPGSSPPGDATRGVRLGDLLPHTDPEQARLFLETLFGQTRGLVGLSLLPTGRVDAARSGFDTWSDARKLLDADPTWWRFAADDWPRWNTYVQVGSTLRSRPDAGKRGTAQQALELVGVFSDLDVKPDNGTFRTRAELDTFLDVLPEPSVVVNTAGSDGGVHAYWLFDRPHVVGSWRDRAELDGWFDYTASVAASYGRTVDHVQEYARILRVPGTVRWPRRGDGIGQPGTWRPVELARSDGPRYRREDLLALTEPHRTHAVERHADDSRDWHDVRDAQLRWLESAGLSRATQAALETRFNSTQDWGPLLEAAGWRLCRDNRGRGGTTDCRYWTRPGKRVEDGHSAMTDFGDSQVMFIYTDDPLVTPCLVPTHDRFRKITTKYAFALHFLAGGDEAKLVKAIHTGKGRVA